MGGWIRGLGLAVGMAGIWMGLSAFGPPPKVIKIALQEGSPAAWEAAAMHELQLDEKNEIKLKIRNVADRKAGQEALQAGKVDVILSDFVWTSLQRAEGADFTIVPHGLADGGLMAMPGGKVSGVIDLKGAALVASGEAGDVGYLILQAYYQAKTGGDLTKDAVTTFGAPSEVNAQLAGGQADAGLSDGAAGAQASGAVQVVSAQAMLQDMGLSTALPVMGWVFPEAFAAKEPEAIKGFLEASSLTRAALLADDALWDKIRPKMKVADDAQFIALRDAYRAAVVPGDADVQAAQDAYALLAGFGGAAGAATLAEGTFWAGFRE